MIHENGKEIDETTGEIISDDAGYKIVRKGGLYAPQPIPAYKILGKTRQYAAQRVLMCLVAHMGYQSRSVFPSYDQIEALSGVRGNDISSALDQLLELGFIKVYQFRKEKKKYNKYYIQEACYKPHLMHGDVQRLVDILGLCARCYKPMVIGDFHTFEGDSRHYKCGGGVMLNKRGRKLVPMAEKGAYEGN